MNNKIRMELITKIYNLLVKKHIFEIYDNMSTDEHTIMFETEDVTVYGAGIYDYVDIIGLTSSEFLVLQTALDYTKN